MSITAPSQVSVGITFGGIGYHPQKSENSKFYKWKVDKKGHFVGFAGMTFNVSYRFNDYVGVKLIQSVVGHDCAGKFAGVTHVGVELYDDIIGLRDNRHDFSMSFGPMLYYRNNWSREPGYVNDPDFIRMSSNQKWERKFIWHGGQIQYDYRVTDQESFQVNFMPGHPYLYSFMAGYGLKIEPAE